MKLKTILLLKFVKEDQWVQELVNILLLLTILLSATSDGISIASFATATGDPLWIASASLIFAFSLTTGIIKEPLKTT